MVPGNGRPGAFRPRRCRRCACCGLHSICHLAPRNRPGAAAGGRLGLGAFHVRGCPVPRNRPGRRGIGSRRPQPPAPPGLLGFHGRAPACRRFARSGLRLACPAAAPACRGFARSGLRLACPATAPACRGFARSGFLRSGGSSFLRSGVVGSHGRGCAGFHVPACGSGLRRQCRRCHRSCRPCGAAVSSLLPPLRGCRCHRSCRQCGAAAGAHAQAPRGLIPAGLVARMRAPCGASMNADDNRQRHDR